MIDFLNDLVSLYRAIAKILFWSIALYLMLQLVVNREAVVQHLRTALHARENAVTAYATGKIDPIAAHAAKVAADADKTVAAATRAVNQANSLLASTQEKIAALDTRGISSRANTLLDSAKATSDSLQPLGPSIADNLRPIQHAAQQVDDSLPMFLDCDHNPDCVFNRYVGVARSVEQTGRAVQDAAPRVTKAVEGITDDGHQMTSTASRWVDRELAPPGFWDKVKGWLETFSFVLWKVMGI